MNTIKTLLLLSFSILLFNCSDEEDKKTEKEFIFSASELKQTEWEGEFLYLTNGEIDSKGSIKIVFYTEKKGVCEYKFDYHIDPGHHANIHHFNLQILEFIETNK